MFFDNLILPLTYTYRCQAAKNYSGEVNRMFVRVIKDVNNKREMKKIYTLREATVVLKELFKAGYELQITAIKDKE